MHAFPLVVAKFSASVFSHQVRQWVRIQQPRLRPDGPHVFQGVNWRLPSRLHVTSQTFSHDATVVPFAKRHWDLCLCAQFLQIVDPPQATEEKCHSNKKNVSFFFFCETPCTVLAWDGVLVWERFCLRCCAQQWNKVLHLWDQWPPFSLCRCTRQIRRKAALAGLHLLTFCFKICKSCNLDRLYWIEVSVYKTGASSPTWGPNDRLCNCLVFQVGTGEVRWWWWGDGGGGGGWGGLGGGRTTTSACCVG